MGEGHAQRVEKFLLLRSQFQRIPGIHGGKRHVQHLIGLPLHGHGSMLKIHLFQKPPSLHLILRMASYDLSLNLKLHDSHRLMHLSHQPRVHDIIDILVQNMRHKPNAWIVLIHTGRKHGQRPQVDTVTVLQHVKAVVADGDAQHIADAGQIARGRSHPGDIMVAPLDIHIVKLHQLIHNQIRPWTPVKNIPYNMKVVNGQVLNQAAQGDDELVRGMYVYDGTDNLTVINPLVLPLVIHMQKLINNIGKLFGELLAHLGAGILGGHHLADLHQAVDVDPLPLIRCLPGRILLPQSLVRIIDQIGQRFLVLLRDHITEGFLDLFPDNPRRASQKMDKRLMFPVKIAEKVFRTFGQPPYSSQVDNLTGRSLDGGILPGQKLQIR